MPFIGFILDHGYLAVDLFFILSGFVIALNYQHKFSALKPQPILRFLGYRLARVYPLHLAVLMLFLLNPVLFFVTGRPIPPERYDAGYWIQSLFLVQNWGFSNLFAWNFPAWSISTEWAAYLTFPLLAWGAGRLSFRLQLGAILLALTLLALLGQAAGGLGEDIPHFGLPRCLLEFSTGILLYGLWKSSKLPDGHWPVASLAACIIITWLCSLHDYWAAPVTLVLLIWGLLSSHSLLGRYLSHSTILAIGEISYSTYLVHYLIKDWVKLALLRADVSLHLGLLAYIVLVLIASIILYWVVEQPGRHTGRRWTDRLLQPKNG